jgi:uncharacterized protein YneF (UPF0154 family)
MSTGDMVILTLWVILVIGFLYGMFLIREKLMKDMEDRDV